MDIKNYYSFKGQKKHGFVTFLSKQVFFSHNLISSHDFFNMNAYQNICIFLKVREDKINNDLGFLSTMI